MKVDHWQALQNLFMRARAVQGEERERLLRAHTDADPELVVRVRSLLAADAAPGIMDALADRLASVSNVLEDSVPERIGPYRIVSELGRGGMGVVYLAERADGHFQKRVAIKLIASADSDDPLHQRFLAERQILADLVHPNIARLLDGGLTEDGRPYLVLEYVDGLPITTYCDRHRLDIRERLRLFADVCAAVQHAHGSLVIHRDLKPSNILVSNDARVHLLDFGIAKLIRPTATAHDPLTRAELRVMTPEYASPEQVTGDSLTTASDIYSLGVLLYELMCGQAPYQFTTSSPAQVLAAVCERDPERPSARASDRLARTLQGDLDGIVMMAMRKEPDRRYASADMLRQDIERYLSGLPVIAHRGSRRYRIEKLIRRHRIEAAAAAIVLATLVSGLSIAVAEGRRATRERDRAEQALAQSESVTNFMMELFRTGDADRETPPTQLSALDLLERGRQRASELSDQPVVQARLLDVVGQMSLHLGRFDEARDLLEQAVEIRRAAPGPPSLDLAASLLHLSWVHRRFNEFERARILVAEALQIRQRRLDPNHPDVAEALYELGWLNFGKEQEALYRQALSILPDTGLAAERRVALLQALSTNLRRQAIYDGAVAAGREALRVAERAFGADHATTGYAMIHLADHIHDIVQDVDEAERLYRRGLELMTRRFGENSTRLIHGLHSLGALLAERGDNEAERLFRRSLAIRQSATGPEHPQVADELHVLAVELMRQQRLKEAEALVRRALHLSSQSLGPRHSVVTNARMPLLAEILNQQGRQREADELYKSALELTEAPGIALGQLRRAYGSLLLRQGKFARAEEQLLEALAILEYGYGDAEHPNVQETKRGLMELYRQWSKPDLVERYRVPPGRFIPH